MRLRSNKLDRNSNVLKILRYLIYWTPSNLQYINLFKRKKFNFGEERLWWCLSNIDIYVYIYMYVRYDHVKRNILSGPDTWNVCEATRFSRSDSRATYIPVLSARKGSGFVLEDLETFDTWTISSRSGLRCIEPSWSNVVSQKLFDHSSYSVATGSN